MIEFWLQEMGSKQRRMSMTTIAVAENMYNEDVSGMEQRLFQRREDECTGTKGVVFK